MRPPLRGVVASVYGLLAGCAAAPPDGAAVQPSDACEYALHHVLTEPGAGRFDALLGGERLRLQEPPYLGPERIRSVRSYGTDRLSGRELLLIELTVEAAAINVRAAEERAGERISLTCDRQPLAAARLIGPPQRRFLIARPPPRPQQGAE